jgi:hypothetical protein
MVAKKTTAVKAKHSVDKPNEVNYFMANLDHPLKPEIEAVRAIILGADKRINESIKWNAPSFFIQEHFATFKLHPRETIQVVFHTGAKLKTNATEVKINDPSGVLKWIAKDRGMVTFSNMKKIRSKKTALAAVVKQWVKQM